MAEELERRTSLARGTYTGLQDDEVLVKSMSRRVVEYLKKNTWGLRVRGWSGIGMGRVMDHVAAILDKNEDDFFFGCVRVRVNSLFPSSLRDEIRNKIQDLLQTPLIDQKVGRVEEDKFWLRMLIKMKWRPMVVMIENKQEAIGYYELGIPDVLTDRQGNRHFLIKIVYTKRYGTSESPPEMTDRDKRKMTSLFVRGYRPIKAMVERDFYQLPNETALRMILHEAHSAAVSTKSEAIPSLLRWWFSTAEEHTTSMTVSDLAASSSHLLQDDIAPRLTGEYVIQCLSYFVLFSEDDDVFPLDYLKSEDFPFPGADVSENSWSITLLFIALFHELRDRNLLLEVGYLPSDSGNIIKYVIGNVSTAIKLPFNRFRVDRRLREKLLDIAASSSSSSTMSPLKGYVERNLLERIDMAEWNQYMVKISLANNQIKEIVLPPVSSIVCFQELSTLILRKNYKLEEIPNNIFLYTPNLRVLDLSHCGIRTLPSSLSCLRSLRMLSLEHCSKLQTVETTGLGNLEVLNLKGCGLPMLRKASWCHMNSLKRIHYQEGLCSLQELQLSLKSVKVFDDFNYKLPVATSLAVSLKKCNIAVLRPKEGEDIPIRTTMLDARFQSSQFPYKQIHRDPIMAGVDKSYDKRLEINGGEGLWSLYTISLVIRPQLLSLRNYQNAKAGIWPIPELQTCYIEDCDDMEYAFNSPVVDDKYRWKPLNLESLWISGLAKLKEIWNFRVQRTEAGFLLLKYIYIDYCPNLLVLFSATVSLPELEEMKIRFCPRLVKLFEAQRMNIVLPKLRRLHLTELPKLTSICDVGHLPLLRNLEVRGCWNLRKFPFPSCDPRGSGVAAEVVVVRGEEAWWKTVHVQGFNKDSIDFKPGFASAAQKHIPARWKRERRPRPRF